MISESWERPDFTLEQLLPDLQEEYEIISNPHARSSKRQGGRPAIIIKRDKFNIKNLTNTVVNIPWKVEATWAAITPKNVSQNSVIKKIILCAFYYPGPHSKIKTRLLDHICQTFHLLTAKYGEGTHFILCADANKLDLSSILRLSPSMKQLVMSPTRLNPPNMLDPIITTLGKWYQTPVCLPALDADPGSGGKPSDHLIPLMRPINIIDNKSARIYKHIKVRPLADSIMALLRENFENKNWENVFNAKSANNKADIFYSEVMQIIDQFEPEKIRKFSNDDQSWYTETLKK